MAVAERRSNLQHASSTSPYCAALDFSPEGDRVPLPGSFGTDLLLKLWNRDHARFATVGALSEPYVRCSDEACAMIARAEDHAWRLLLSHRPGMTVAIGGRGRFRSGGALWEVPGATHGGTEARWVVRLPGGGTIEGRFTVSHPLPFEHRADNGNALFELGSSAPVKISVA